MTSNTALIEINPTTRQTVPHIERRGDVMKAYQPLDGNVLAEYKDSSSGATVCIMDTFIRDTPPEEMQKREERACAVARRILERGMYP